MAGRGQASRPSGSGQEDDDRQREHYQTYAHYQQGQQGQQQPPQSYPSHQYGGGHQYAPPQAQESHPGYSGHAGHAQSPPPPHTGYGTSQTNTGGYRPPPPPHHEVPDEGPHYAYFQDGAGINREVIQADIQRYLGPDAVSKPGSQNGVQGFWISGYRTFTPAQVQDLQIDSANFESEKRRKRNNHFKYIKSDVHRTRQYWGASDLRPRPDQPAPAVETPAATVQSSAGPSHYYQPQPSQSQSQPQSHQHQQTQPAPYNYTTQNPGSSSGGYSTGGDSSFTPRLFAGGESSTSGYGVPANTSSAYGAGGAAAPQVTRTDTHYLASDGKWYPNSAA